MADAAAPLDLDRMWWASPLLPPPGEEVVKSLITALRAERALGDELAHQLRWVLPMATHEDFGEHGPTPCGLACDPCEALAAHSAARSAPAPTEAVPEASDGEVTP